MSWNPPELLNLGLATLTVAVFLTLVAAGAWGRTMAHPIAPAGAGGSAPAGGWVLALARRLGVRAGDDVDALSGHLGIIVAGRRDRADLARDGPAALVASRASRLTTSR